LEQAATLRPLDIRLEEINDALEKIEENRYGECEICSEDIEEDRLEVNPAARTCKKHL
jgi:RNA polymerase-binding transcription factor DksA